MVDAAKQQWALENGKPSTAIPTAQDLESYFGRGETFGFPQEKGVTFLHWLGWAEASRPDQERCRYVGWRISTSRAMSAGRQLAYQVPPPSQQPPPASAPQALSASAASTPYTPQTKTMNDAKKVIGITYANPSDLTEALESFDKARITMTSGVVATSGLQSRSAAPGSQQESTAAATFGERQEDLRERKRPESLAFSGGLPPISMQSGEAEAKSINQLDAQKTHGFPSNGTTVTANYYAGSSATCSPRIL